MEAGGWRACDNHRVRTRPTLRAVFTGLYTLSFIVRAAGQIKVMSPLALQKLFTSSNGRIDGSTATFGAPFYGDRVLGRVVYGPSLMNQTHCTEDDYKVPLPEVRGRADGDQVRLIHIILVRRGRCSFTTKVKVADKKGAHAVIIVDREDSDLTQKDLMNIIVADDGFGDKIRIPSVLITKTDGNRMIDSIQRGEEVVVEMAWDVPTNHVVQTDLWMSSGSQESLKFLKEFTKPRRVLNEVVIFQPHYAVFGMDRSDSRVYHDLCSDETGRFCAEDPDGAGPITGRMVLEEDVRQLCIHELNKVPRTSYLQVQTGHPPVEFAAKYWDYVERFADRCPLEADNPSDRFGIECAERLMREVSIDSTAVNRCISSTKEVKLQHERDNQAWSPRALRINGWRYSGVLDTDLVTRAICSGFITQPSECDALVRVRDPFQAYTGAPPPRGVTFGQLVFWLMVTLFIAFIGLLLYKRYLKKHLRATLREEVTLEVESAMAKYSRMDNH